MIKQNAASLRGGGVFCLGIWFEARGHGGPAISVSLARGQCGRVVALLHCSSEPIEAGTWKKTEVEFVDDCGSSRPRDLSRQ